MKPLFIFFFSIIFSFTAFAQSDVKTDTLNVDGNCNMCKKRIENAAFVKGVKRADWDKETHKLTVIYRPSKTTTEAIAKNIAKAGHSTSLIKATEKDYEGLPECCHYKTNVCEH